MFVRPTGWFCRRGATDTADAGTISRRGNGNALSNNRQPRAEGLCGKAQLGVTALRDPCLPTRSKPDKKSCNVGYLEDEPSRL